MNTATPRIRLRRFARSIWSDVLENTRAFELEIDEPSAVGTVLNFLRRYHSTHCESFFIVTIKQPCLLLIERTTQQPSNPLTGKPCSIRVEREKSVDEAGVVEELARVGTTFTDSVSRRAFRSFLAQCFQDHVLKHRRTFRRLGLDYDAMCQLATGMFEQSARSLEGQALRALIRAKEELA
jgi:hypothetical protein